MEAKGLHEWEELQAMIIKLPSRHCGNRAQPFAVSRDVFVSRESSRPLDVAVEKTDQLNS